MVEEIDEQKEKVGNTSSHDLNLKNKNEPTLNGKRNVLPDKIFVLRQSVLSKLFEDKHIKTLYHTFIAFLMGLFINTVAKDYLENGEINVGMKLIVYGFGKLHIALASWLLSYSLVCLGYVCFRFWAEKRKDLFPKSVNLKLWDFGAVVSLIVYYIFSFVLAPSIVTYFELPVASAVIVLIEQVRLIMKFHAFVRGNAPKVLRFKPGDKEKCADLPNFRYFLFFTFIPTLVYRDEYPRTDKIRWDFVAKRTLEVFGVIFYYSFVLDRLLAPLYADFGKTKIHYSQLFIKLLDSAVTGILLLLLTFYVIFHTVQNLFGELLRFGDRLFYKDWWTATSYNTFFRSWNVVVQDWLYTYIYKDLYDYVIPNNRTVARLSVFVISAVVHEYILMYMFGFFLPVCFILIFPFGMMLSMFDAPKSSILNVFFCYSVALGSGIMTTCYAMEFFARINCPSRDNSIWHMTPRFFSCDCFV